MTSLDSQKYCTFYLLRHAVSQGNEAGLRIGQMDFDLSEKGKQQATKIAQEFKDIHFAAVFSSDLLRSKRTAEIVSLEHKIAVQTSSLIRERKWGKKLQGKTREQTKKLLESFLAMNYKERLKIKVFPDMESDEEVISRLITFLRETALAYVGESVLVVSHANIIRTFLAHLGYATHQQLKGALEPGGYVKLRSDGVEFFIEETKGLNLK